MNRDLKVSKKSNQEIERHYFNMFSKDYRLPEGEIIFEDKPDVILQGRKKIGIEITNFYLENGGLLESEQKQRVVREKVVRKAQEIYLANGGKRIELSFTFDTVVPVQNRNCMQIANKIAVLARNIEESKTGLIRKNVIADIPELLSVYLNAEEYENPKWKISQTYSGQFMSMERLRNIVNNKEECSKAYQACDAYWLIVVVDSFDRAQDQEILLNNDERIVSAIFEKIIVYKTYFGQILEINCNTAAN